MLSRSLQSLLKQKHYKMQVLFPMLLPLQGVSLLFFLPQGVALGYEQVGPSGHSSLETNVPLNPSTPLYAL